MPLSALLDLCAGLRAALDEGKQAAYFVERKAEFAAAQDEAQAGYVVLAINAVAGGRARRVRHPTDFLVIADGFQIAARKLCQVRGLPRSEERRVGQEQVRACRFWWLTHT